MQLLRILAFPISLAYMLVVYFRNWLYDQGIFKSTSFRTTLVCIGNLSVGGTGKTPMVEYLISALTTNFKIAVLSRGYKRRSKGFLLADPKCSVEQLGDEPYQIHKKFPKISVAVDANRTRAIGKLEKEVRPDIILLDDAYQHRKVKAHLYVLLTAYGDLYANDWYLPTGNLRDSKGEAGRAHIIVVTKCPQNLSALEQKEIRNQLKPKPHQDLLFSYLDYDVKVRGEEVLTIDFFETRPFTLVTGIANPVPLVNHLASKGLSFEHLQFNDHHFFTEKEIGQLQSKDFVLTTEKDFARLKGKIKNVYYIEVKHRFFQNQSEVLLEKIKALTR